MLLAAGCGIALTPDLNVDGPIVVGVSESQISFVHLDEAGDVSGVFVDMVRDLGLYLNRETEVKLLDENGLVGAVGGHTVDLAFVLLPPPDMEERPGVVFSKPFAWKSLAFLTDAESELDGLEDLNAEGRTVAVIANHRANSFARTSLPQAAVKVLNSETEAVSLLLAGQADGFIHDSLRIFELADEQRGRFRAVLEPFRRVGVSLAVSADNEALLDAVNDFMHDYREIGGFERLADRYFAEAREAFAVQGADFLFDPPERVMIEDSEPGLLD